MKKNLLAIFVGIIALMGFALTSCSSEADTKVKNFVEVLNSDNFKSQVVATGILTDSKASVEGDYVLLVYKVVPGLNFKDASDQMIVGNKAELVENLKASMSKDADLKDGFEGMKEKNMKLRMQLEDVAGNSIHLDISPDEVL
jgi:hypothetical protein